MFALLHINRSQYTSLDVLILSLELSYCSEDLSGDRPGINCLWGGGSCYTSPGGDGNYSWVIYK